MNDLNDFQVGSYSYYVTFRAAAEPTVGVVLQQVRSLVDYVAREAVWTYTRDDLTYLLHLELHENGFAGIMYLVEK